MEYQDVDEITKQAACENVKKIVNAIKLLRIKYYPNFRAISEEDQRVFQELRFDLERIASENNLQSLKDALMSELSAKYEKNEDKEQNGVPVTNDSLLMACYGAIDVEKQALSEGKIKQAIRCQKILDEYVSQIESDTHKKLVIDYKREKLGELIGEKDIPSEIIKWTNLLQGCCKVDDVQDRNYVADMIASIVARDTSETIQEEDKTNEELVMR